MQRVEINIQGWSKLDLILPEYHPVTSKYMTYSQPNVYLLLQPQMLPAINLKCLSFNIVRQINFKKQLTSNNEAPHLNAPKLIHAFAKPSSPEASPYRADTLSGEISRACLNRSTPLMQKEHI